MGVKDRYKKCMDMLSDEKYGYCIVNNSTNIEDQALRVGTNIFGEFLTLGKFPLYFP